MRIFQCIKEFEVPYLDRSGQQCYLKVAPGANFTAEDDHGQTQVALDPIRTDLHKKIGVSRNALEIYFTEIT